MRAEAHFCREMEDTTARSCACARHETTPLIITEEKVLLTFAIGWTFYPSQIQTINRRPCLAALVCDVKHPTLLERSRACRVFPGVVDSNPFCINFSGHTCWILLIILHISLLMASQ